MKFKLHSQYKPTGSQPEAIKSLVFGLNKGMRKQTLLGVTGSGKTFTIANVIEQVQKPTLVIAHNKTLAAQLCNEFREFFPKNAVEYFVSYYDYYQPEAYMPGSDTYIEKEAQINEEIDRLRHACTQALITRQDVIIVASVSAIYSLGNPKDYEKDVLHLRLHQKLDRRGMLEQLVAMQFERTSLDLKRGQFRMRGQVFEVMPVNEEIIYRLEISDSIDLIERVDPVTRRVVKTRGVETRLIASLQDVWLFPAKHYVVGPDAVEKAFNSIKIELKDRLDFFKKKKKILEYERLKRKVKYDLEMIKNVGYCNGIENYSSHFEGREKGEPPFTLLDYFRFIPTPTLRRGRNLSEEKQNEISKSQVITSASGKKDFSPFGFEMNYITVIDESHVTIPQIRGMSAGDKARKEVLVEHGFRLPSAHDNRPLNYKEFEERVNQTIYVSATPSEYEATHSDQIVEQVVRPTGLVDPEIVLHPITEKPGKNKSQVEDLLIRIAERIKINERVLVTTLTKKMSEDLNEYLKEKKIKSLYLHSDIKTIERVDIITKLRRGEIDVIVGVNLLREGLDIPEVSLVAILDADKEGFLRNETSLIQTIGRAARNVNGQVVMYADNITKSIEKAVKETARRRKVQLAYNEKYGITPKTIQKAIKNILEEFGLHTKNEGYKKTRKQSDDILKLDLMGDKRPIAEIIRDKEEKMRMAAKNLDFEVATILRDELVELKKMNK